MLSPSTPLAPSRLIVPQVSLRNSGVSKCASEVKRTLRSNSAFLAIWTSCVDTFTRLRMYGQCCPSPVSLCLAPSPCTRLSRAPSTVWASPTSTAASTFLRRVPIGWSTRPSSGRDDDGSPRFLTLPFRTCRALRPRRSLRQSSPLVTAYCCLPELRLCRPADDNLTRLNRFTCVTARPSLCLRLAHVVTSISPRLDSRWGGYPLAGAGFSPAESAKLRLAHRKSH